MKLRLLASGLILISTGVNPSAGQDEDLPSQAVQILGKYCYQCHGVDFKYPGLDMLDRATLLEPKDKAEKPFIVPKDPDQSRIWQAVGEHDPQQMPPEDQPQPSDDEKAVLKKWIEAGAEFPAATRPQRPYRGEDEILAMIARDLERVPSEHRRFTRYFSLLHLWNDPAASDDDLRLVRAAVSKLMNSLSRESRITAVRPIADDGLVLAIDRRDYGWDKGRRWDILISQANDRPGYPYGLSRGSDEARRVYELTDCDLPYVRADWFVYHASRPPLYHDLLALPANQKALEQELGVNSIENFDRDRVARAAFRKSGVSDHARMVQRQDAKNGTYWDSFDIESDGGEADFFIKPLGPIVAGRNNRAAFKHAGGEVIYHLPNGLIAFYLAAADGRRIDEGPINIVRDPQQFSGTNAIVNGISCMGCHKQGFIKFTDTLRAGYENLKGQPVADKVLKIFPPQDAMDRLLEDDRERYLRSLDKAMGEFLTADAADRRNAGDFTEPITYVARRYDRKLDLEAIARELLLPSDEQTAVELKLPTVGDLKSQLKLSETFQRIGLEPLARGEVVSRDEWEKSFHAAARALKLGVPQHFGN
jgi:serine/threonine-protein kinase